MTERPILFSGPMVRALLAGTKTQTRRVVKPQPANGTTAYLNGVEREWDRYWPVSTARNDYTGDAVRCPYGQPGDTLWVRETFAEKLANTGRPLGWAYRADGERADYELGSGRWVPSIHMPRVACRLKLEVTGVRVERLKDISEDDARAEGTTIVEGGLSPQEAYMQLWDSINEDRDGCAWRDNPWVWVVEFKTVRPSDSRTSGT